MPTSLCTAGEHLHRSDPLRRVVVLPAAASPLVRPAVYLMHAAQCIVVIMPGNNRERGTSVPSLSLSYRCPILYETCFTARCLSARACARAWPHLPRAL